MGKYIILWNSGEYELSNIRCRLDDTAIRMDSLLFRIRESLAVTKEGTKEHNIIKNLAYDLGFTEDEVEE